jgi:hypothetical protein
MGVARCAGSGGWSGGVAHDGRASIRAAAEATIYEIACDTAGGEIRARARVPALGATAPTFPLRAESGRRYLVDSAGRPFLLKGDAAWSLLVQLRREDVDLYLQSRRALGFNALLVNLIEHRFARDAPRNAYGQSPFLIPGDFRSVNEAYFEHADWVLRRAASAGFLVLLAPAYLGYGGGIEGWYADMKGSDASALRDYGRYVGRRYREYSNVFWVLGGDYNPPDRSVVRAVAAGIFEESPGNLATAHCGPESAALDYWPDEPWLQVNNVYTYAPVHGVALTQYRRMPIRPFFLIESTYENEHHATARQLRTQAYHAMLAGAFGHVFGNNPIWHFGSPYVKSAQTWRQALASTGSQDMARLSSLFESLDWWRLVPDVDDRLLMAGRGSGPDQAVAAAYRDGSLAMVYVPTARRVVVDLRQMRGPAVVATWYEPATGTFVSAGARSLRNASATSFSTPEATGEASSDWVLILESGPP